MLDDKELPFWSVHFEEKQARCKEVSATVRRLAIETQSRDQFLQRVVNLMVDKFVFYYAGIFLLDTVKQRLVLKAGTGEHGRILLERKFELYYPNIDITGEAISRNAVCVDPGGGPVKGFFYLPLLATGLPEPTSSFQFVDKRVPMPGSQLLPETRNRCAFPLRAARQIVGVLEMHNIYYDAHAIIPLFLPLADQIAQVCEDWTIRE
jgi:hypothetical protein